MKFLVLYDKPEIAGILLDAGADPKLLSMEGKIALDYAQYSYRRTRS